MDEQKIPFKKHVWSNRFSQPLTELVNEYHNNEINYLCKENFERLEKRVIEMQKNYDFDYDDIRIVLPIMEIKGIKLEFDDVRFPLITGKKRK